MLCYAREGVFDAVERAFVSAFAAQAAHVLKRVSAFELQSNAAELLQRSLLPDTFPVLPGLAVAAHYAPAAGSAEVGGDWFDVLPLHDGSILVVIGDVMGRGVPAGVVMGQVRAALRAYALLDATPELVLARLDRLVATLGVPEQIIAVLVGVVSADRSVARFASAGHPPPVCTAPGTSARLAVTPEDPPLGLAVEHRTGITVPVSPGAVLVMATDGMVELPPSRSTQVSSSCAAFRTTRAATASCPAGHLRPARVRHRRDVRRRPGRARPDVNHRSHRAHEPRRVARGPHGTADREALARQGAR